MGNDLLKPGRIGISLRHRGQFDIIGRITTFLQGDTKAKHVWMVAEDGDIYTTGGKLFAFFGKVPAAKYLKNMQYGTDYVLAEPVDGFQPGDLDILEAVNQSMVGQFYGFWKYAQLEAAATEGDGFVSELGTSNLPTTIKHPICSQAVAIGYWHIGRPIGSTFGVKSPDAVIPELILEEAQCGRIIKLIPIPTDS